LANFVASLETAPHGQFGQLPLGKKSNTPLFFAGLGEIQRLRV
jgi:hypothetical protein